MALKIEWARRPACAAVLAALSLPAQAQPGGGQVTGGSVNGVGTGGALVNLPASPTLTVDTTSAVVEWGAVGDSVPLGFHVEAGQTLTVADGLADGIPGALLNIDISGNPSQILGTIQDAGVNDGVRLFLANENGLVVGGSASFVLPRGLGLLGAVPDTAAFLAGTVNLDFSAGGGTVDIQGADLGQVGSYLLIAGAGTVNVDLPHQAPAVPVTISGGVGGSASVSGGGFSPAAPGVATDVTLGMGSALDPFTGPDLVALASGDIHHHGVLEAGDVTLRAAGTLTNTGRIMASDDVLLAGLGGGGTTSGAAGLDNAGTIEAGSLPTHNLTFLAQAVTNTGTLRAGGFVLGAGGRSGLVNVAFAGGTFTNQGTLEAGTHMALLADTLDNQGNLQAPGTVNLRALNDVQNGGTVTAGDLVIGRAGGVVPLATGPGGTTGIGGNLVNSGTLSADTLTAVVEGDITGGGTFAAGHFDFTVGGSLSNPVSPSDFLQNGVHLDAPPGGATLSLSAGGSASQFINILVDGDVIVDSGDTVSAGQVVGGVYQPPANGGSSLILQATGDITVVGGSGQGISGAGRFHFPGGVVFLSRGPDGVVHTGDEGTLTVSTSVDNAWVETGTAFQGQFYEGGEVRVADGVNFYTNVDNWVNFSVPPVDMGGAPIPALAPRTFTGRLSGGLFVPINDAGVPHQNTYSEILAVAVAGGPWSEPAPLGPIHPDPLP